uniref:pyridoxal 5'-phosphate synthase n=1 Tax=Loa loa TaxID=7209 RepID=A0A1I7V995_LOALO
MRIWKTRKVELEKLVAEKGEEAITRPEDWGAIDCVHTIFEFWQGQTDRIHDRIVFEKGADETEWLIKRLSP